MYKMETLVTIALLGCVIKLNLILVPVFKNVNMVRQAMLNLVCRLLQNFTINADLVITPVQQVQLNLIREDVVVQQQMNVEQKLVIILIKSVVLG